MFVCQTVTKFNQRKWDAPIPPIQYIYLLKCVKMKADQIKTRFLYLVSLYLGFA